jgi:hypothetical protein
MQIYAVFGSDFDANAHYQALINLALDPDNDYASAFGLRLRTTF